VLRFLPLVLLCGCVATHNPHPSDTAFDESKRNWLEVFEGEIIIAIENDDAESYHFFMQELLAEKIRIWKQEKTNKP
jgi:hypothetical protein